MAGRLLALLVTGIVALLLLADDPADPPRPASAAVQQCHPAVGEQMLGDALLHVPAGRTPSALVLAFHGAGGTGPGFAAESGLSATADKYGFAVLYPSAAAHHF